MLVNGFKVQKTIFLSKTTIITRIKPWIFFVSFKYILFSFSGEECYFRLYTRLLVMVNDLSAKMISLFFPVF